MKTKEELLKKYTENQKTIEGLKVINNDILRELTTLVEHSVGEIVKWVEHPRKNVGSWLHPKYEELTAKEHVAVLTSIKASVWVWKDGAPNLSYTYDFNPIKKDGSLSKNHCYPNKDTLEWTGEIFKDYLKTEDNGNKE